MNGRKWWTLNMQTLFSWPCFHSDQLRTRLAFLIPFPLDTLFGEIRADTVVAVRFQLNVFYLLKWCFGGLVDAAISAWVWIHHETLIICHLFCSVFSAFVFLPLHTEVMIQGWGLLNKVLFKKMDKLICRRVDDLLVLRGKIPGQIILFCWHLGWALLSGHAQMS